MLPESSVFKSGFSIGICAADSAANLQVLLKFLESETYPLGFVLRRVVLVASGCEPKAVEFAKQLALRDNRFVIIEEPMRRGKSVAINQVLDSFVGEFLVLVNSDALPEGGAISALLREIGEDNNIGVVSASPIVGGKPGITTDVLRLMWGVHNECLMTLNQNDRNNHCCDELIVARASVLRKLPTNTVNDGAYLSAAAYKAGYYIRFSEEARVKIDVPCRLVDLMRQRRRIVYGHVQIRKSVGESPRTVESMLTENPIMSFSILVKTLSKSPRLILAVPVALIGEIVSVILAMYDNLTATERHTLWDRVGNRS